MRAHGVPRAGAGLAHRRRADDALHRRRTRAGPARRARRARPRPGRRRRASPRPARGSSSSPDGDTVTARCRRDSSAPFRSPWAGARSRPSKGWARHDRAATAGTADPVSGSTGTATGAAATGARGRRRDRRCRGRHGVGRRRGGRAHHRARRLPAPGRGAHGPAPRGERGRPGCARRGPGRGPRRGRGVRTGGGDRRRHGRRGRPLSPGRLGRAGRGAGRGAVRAARPTTASGRAHGRDRIGRRASPGRRAVDGYCAGRTAPARARRGGSRTGAARQGGSPHRRRARRCNSTDRRPPWLTAPDTGLLEQVPAGPGRSGNRGFAPQTAVGPERPPTPTPEPAPPRLGRRRPARPPTGRPAAAYLRSRADTAAERVAARRPAPARRPPCPAARCRCRTWATARTTGSRCGTRSPEIGRTGGGQPAAAAPRAPARRSPAPPGWPSCTNTVGRPVCGCSAVDMPPMSQRSQIANSGSSPIAACSAACSAPGTRAASHPDGVEGRLVEVVPDRRGCAASAAGRSSGTVSSTVPSGAAPLVRHHLRGHRHLAERTPAPGRGRGRRAPRTTSTSAVERASVRQSGSAARTSATPASRSSVLAPGSSRRGAGTPRRRARWRAPSRASTVPSIRPVSASTTRHLTEPGAADVHRARRALPGRGPEPPGGPAAQHPVGDQLVEHRPRRRPRRTPRRRRPSVSGSSAAAQASCGRQHVGVAGVEHAALHRRAEQRLRVVHEVGVHRVVAGDEHHQGLVAGPAGPARLLPERRPRAREARHHHRVQPRDVHAQLERVGRGHARAARRRPAPPPAPGAPRAGSRRGRRPPAPPARGRRRRAAAARPARSARRRGGTARTRASAPPPPPGRRASGPPPRPRPAAPGRRSRR